MVQILLYHDNHLLIHGHARLEPTKILRKFVGGVFPSLRQQQNKYCYGGMRIILIVKYQHSSPGPSSNKDIVFGPPFTNHPFALLRAQTKKGNIQIVSILKSNGILGVQLHAT